MKYLIQLLTITFFATSVSATPLTLDQYLEQVKTNNPQYKATLQASEGAKQRSDEGSLLTLPQLEIDASKTVDNTEPTNAAMGDKNTYERYSLSLLQNTSFGLQGKLSYGHQYTFTENGHAMLDAPFHYGYHRASPSIELKQSLWKNFFGSEVRASKEALTASAQAVQFAERAKNIGVIIEAQNTYNNLYYAQKVVKAVKESLEASQKLESWAKRRMNQGLGEKSDYYQTKAASELREIDYLQAQLDVRNAARAFNSFRGIESDDVQEILDEPKSLTFNKRTFTDEIWRDDVRAAQKQAQAAKAQSLLGKERNRPTLDLYGRYAWTGLDSEGRKAHNEAMSDNFPIYTVGVNLVVPLALWKSNNVVDGYHKEALAADLSFKRKMQEQQRDYQNLVSKIETTELKLKLATALEQSQRVKVQEERRRHQRGRTTFFQVLQFEQEYLSSQLNKIKTEAELNSLLTQLQQYRGE